jgi:type III secretion protein D
MKRLRILTGRHAGASLDLALGPHTTGAEPDSDVAITDWTIAPLHIVVSDSDEVLASWSEADAAGVAVQQTHCFVDFEPRAFGDIVLCVGPADQAWPSDLQLLDSTFKPTPRRVARWAGARLRAGAASLLAGASVLALCVMGSVALMSAPKAEMPPETVASMTARVRQALAQAGQPELKVQPDRMGLLIVGMVESTEQAQAVNAAVHGIAGPVAVVLRVAVAAEVAETIRSTVGLAGAEVKHVGDGVFSYTGEAQDPKAVRQAIDRVSADLGDVVRRIDVTLEQTDKQTADIPILSSLKDDEISVVQTRDGVKHLVVAEPERAVSASKALSLPPTGASQPKPH